MDIYKGIKLNTLKQILNAYKVSRERAFFVENLLNLTRTKKVSTVSIEYKGIRGYGLWLYANIAENFEDLTDFKKYLAENDLPQKKTWQEKKSSHFILGADQVRLEFIVKPELNGRTE